MKTILALVMALNTNFDGGLGHRAIPDRLVKKGDVRIQTRDLPESQGRNLFQTRIQYNFLIETFFTTTTREGEEVFTLPSEFKTELGYQNLESDGSFEDSEIQIIHQGRRDWKDFYDCHFVKVIPKFKNTWDSEYFYCPQAPKSGIVELRFRVKNIPLLGEHTIVSQWDLKVKASRQADF